VGGSKNNREGVRPPCCHLCGVLSTPHEPGFTLIVLWGTSFEAAYAGHVPSPPCVSDHARTA